MPYPAYRIDTYMVRHLIYPDTIITGDITVLVTFTVTKTGAITSVYVPYSGSAVHDAAAMHAISSMPDWLPGKMHGSYADIPFSLKVIFKASHEKT
jgi:hypothetical protein